MKLNIIDSCMGSGKTSWAIEKMKSSKPDEKFVYITPFLKEVSRVKDSCSNKRFEEPTNTGKGKQNNFHNLLLEERNITSTHALFRLSNQTTKDLIANGEYTLILDEVMDVVQEIEVKKDDLKDMFNDKHIYIEDGFIKWNTEHMDYDGKHNDVKDMALNNSLIFVNNTVMMWNFPVGIFKSFKEIYILTYYFKSQIQKYYYDLYNIEYIFYSIKKINNKYELSTNMEEIEFRNNLKSKINILDDKINSVGDADYSLSVSWYRKKTSETLIQALKKNLLNYFINKIKTKSDDIMWTTYKDKRSKLNGKGYTKGFVVANSRSTNEYSERHNLAYCVNMFLNPFVNKFFIDRNVKVDENGYALSEMLQWIWRSAIRNNEEINIYIPSKRMRELLISYLNNEI